MDTLIALKRAGILIEKGNGDYKLKTPARIVIGKDVISKLKNIYTPNYERGGVLEGQVRGREIYVNSFTEIPNGATVGYSYSPNMNAFVNQFYEVLGRGNLPFAIHTHPTTLGISHYDSKRARFYQNSSKADQRIARTGVINNLVLPEAIFVSDARLKGGYAINFYTGDNRANIIGSGLVGLSVLKRNLIPALLGGGMILANYIIASENVIENGSGDLAVTIRN